MKYFAKNIRFLRKYRKLTQAEIAAALGFTQSAWNNYENGVSQPILKDFIIIAKFFDTTLDDLLHTDLSKQGNLISAEEGGKNPKKGNLIGNGKGNLIEKKYPKSDILSTVQEPETKLLRMPRVVTVDSDGNENLVLVPVRARAGYLSGYGDPEFVATLPAYRIPGLHNGTFRLFETEGLSMYPTLHPGDLIIGSFVDQLRLLRDDRVQDFTIHTSGCASHLLDSTHRAETKHTDDDRVDRLRAQGGHWNVDIPEPETPLERRSNDPGPAERNRPGQPIAGRQPATKMFEFFASSRLISS